MNISFAEAFILSHNAHQKSEKGVFQLVLNVLIHQPSDAASQMKLSYRFDYVKIPHAMGLIIRTLSLAKSLMKFKLNIMCMYIILRTHLPSPPEAYAI